jgi:hypothetical protein
MLEVYTGMCGERPLRKGKGNKAAIYGREPPSPIRNRKPVNIPTILASAEDIILRLTWPYKFIQLLQFFAQRSISGPTVPAYPHC